MWRTVLRLIGRQAAQKVIAEQTRGSYLDIRFGLTLLRDRRVPGRAKFAALMLALPAMLLINALEIPGETILAVALPALGIPFAVAWNGLENILGPLLLAALALPFLTPKPIIEQIRRERFGLVLDVEHSAPRHPLS